jgi:hypothetical protein
LVVVPFSSVFLANARHLSEDRSRAGDRHLKIHDYWDNLQRSGNSDKALRTTLFVACPKTEHLDGSRSNVTRLAVEDQPAEMRLEDVGQLRRHISGAGGAV